MCQSFGGTPAARLKLLDETVAYDVDMTCRMAVFYHEQQMEAVRLEAMSAGAVRRAVSESPFFTPEGEDYLNQTSQGLGDL